MQSAQPSSDRLSRSVVPAGSSPVVPAGSSPVVPAGSKRGPLYSVATLFLVACAFPPALPTALAQEAPEARKPAAVMSYHGAPWLERETRDEEERPYEVIEKMNLKNGDVVVDMGVGTGYFARKIAKKVAPDGKVLGVDIQPEMLELLKKYCAEENITNVEGILGDEDDPKLTPGTVDWIILADVYHEFQQPEPMLAKMLESLKPDGKIALLEYRLNGETARHIKIEHRMSVEQVLAEWQPAGFELVDIHEFLPAQHFFIFKKKAS